MSTYCSTAAPPPTVYHVADKRNRESILLDGLVPTPDEYDPVANDGVWMWGVRPIPGGYVDDLGRTVAGYNPEKDDVWAVDTLTSLVERHYAEWGPNDPVWVAWQATPARLEPNPDHGS